MQKNEDKVEKNEKKEQRISKGSIDSQISFVYHYNTRILHNGSALAFQARGAGSIPAIRSRANKKFYLNKNTWRV